MNVDASDFEYALGQQLRERSGRRQLWSIGRRYYDVDRDERAYFIERKSYDSTKRDGPLTESAIEEHFEPVESADGTPDGAETASARADGGDQ